MKKIHRRRHCVPAIIAKTQCDIAIIVQFFLILYFFDFFENFYITTHQAFTKSWK
jgi:hypothetical protein